jgi:hypothetical protein
MNSLFRNLLLLALVQPVLNSCNNQAGNVKNNNNMDMENGTETTNSANNDQPSEKFVEGVDYLVYQRVRMLDKVGFTQPQEAYSMALPKGWSHEDEIIWNQPGTSCAGTFKRIKASSADNKYQFEMKPDLVYSWTTNQQLLQWNLQNPGSSPYCTYKQPMDAAQYLKTVFGPEELGNPEILKVEPNPYVVEQMQQFNEQTMQELRQYGAGQMQFFQTAINADVRWPDGTAGIIVLGVNVLESIIPNTYTGTYDKSYTTQVSKRTVFRFPAADSAQAKSQFSVIMASFRSNPMWNDAVNKFWKEARQQSHRVHVGRIQMIDEETRRIGQAAIQKGNERLKSMDSDMRSWEASQSSQDRMHTNFIKTIREVENYQDATGKYEMSSFYNHAWSRGDGSTFLMTNNPNLDPAAVFRDQNWKEMKKVH